MERGESERNTQILELLNGTAVQSHIAMLQGVINRMAGNSANCKTWTIAIIAAFVTLMSNREIISWKWLFIIFPVVVFYVLDCYYLSLERHFIEEQGNFVKALKSSMDIDLLFRVNKTGGFCSQLCSTLKCMKSFSTTPFYGMIVLVIVLVFLIWSK